MAPPAGSHGSDGDDDDHTDGDGSAAGSPWLDRMGHVFLAEPELRADESSPHSSELSLLAVVAYPRDQYPTEAAAAARRFEVSICACVWCSGVHVYFECVYCERVRSE